MRNTYEIKCVFALIEIQSLNLAIKSQVYKLRHIVTLYFKNVAAFWTVANYYSRHSIYFL